MAIHDQIEAIFDSIGDMAYDVGRGILEALKSLMDRIVDGLTGGVSVVVTYVDMIASAAFEAIEGIILGTGAIISELTRGIKSALSGFVGGLSYAMQVVVDGFRMFGDNMMDSINNLMSSAFGLVTSVAERVARGIGDKLTDAVKVFSTVAGNLALMVAGAMERIGESIVAAAKVAGDTLTDAFEAFGALLISALASLQRAIENILEFSEEGMQDAFEQSFKWAKDAMQGVGNTLLEQT